MIKPKEKSEIMIISFQELSKKYQNMNLSKMYVR